MYMVTNHNFVKRAPPEKALFVLPEEWDKDTHRNVVYIYYLDHVQQAQKIFFQNNMNLCFRFINIDFFENVRLRT